MFGYILPDWRTLKKRRWIQCGGGANDASQSGDQYASVDAVRLNFKFV